MGRTLIVLVLACLVSITLVACGESNDGKKIGQSQNVASVPPASKATVSTFSVGDIVQVQDQTIVMNSASIVGNTLTANFTVENQGTKDIIVSSIVSFEARDATGQKLDTDIFAGTSIDGTVLPSDKLRGNISWTGLTTDTAKIYYAANVFGHGAVIWQVTR